MANSASSSGSTGLVQGLLQSLAPWMTGGSPSSLNGLTSAYGGSGLLGAELLANSGPPTTTAARLGRSLLGAQQTALAQAQQRQQLAQGDISTEQAGMMLPFMRAYYRAAMGGGNGSVALPNASDATGSPTPGNGMGASAIAPVAPGVPSAPIVGPLSRRVAAALPSSGNTASSQAAPDSASPFAVPTMDSISSIPVGGLSPQMIRLGGILNRQPPLATATKLRQEQLAIAQQKYGPALAQLDTLDKAQSPTQYVQANPQLMGAWRQMASQLGYDPVKDFSDPNVRTAFSFLRNRIAGSLSEPTVAPPVQMSSVGGPLNSLFTRNPITGAITQVKPEESLKSVVGANGRVSYVPASQAAGQTPFNAETYIDPTTTAGVAKMIANYEMPALNGYALRTPQGQAVMAAVKQLNPKYDATTYATKQQARERFATGKQGDIVRSLSVATSHLDQLSQAADALAQHDFPTFNRISNTFGAHVTGSTPQTNFDAMKSIVGDEVVKAIIGSGGAEADRDEAKEAFDAARSPAQIQGVIAKYEKLMGGQLTGLKRQYQKATGLNDFDSFVSQQAEQQLSGSGTPAPLNIGQSAAVGGFTVTRVK